MPEITFSIKHEDEAWRVGLDLVGLDWSAWITEEDASLARALLRVSERAIAVWISYA